MADKRGDGMTKAMHSMAAFGAAFAARKVLTAGWKRATGKEPPVDPQDPGVSIMEALGWAIAMGVVVGAVRVLAIRAVEGMTRRGSEAPADR
jgi:hypothetical protein